MIAKPLGMESQMTKHEPGLWAELNEYISDIRSSLVGTGSWGG